MAPTLEKQRRDALVFEIACWAFAIVGPAIATWLLRARIPAMLDQPIYIAVPLIPAMMVAGAALGFRRLRKGIERQMRG